MANALRYLIEVVVSLATFIFIARFLIQACRVDFYNPISQGFVKLTDPILKPVRLVLPSYRNLDIAAFLAAVLVQFLGFLLISGQGLAGFGLLFGFASLQIVLLVLKILRWGIIIMAIVSFISPGNPHPAIRLLEQLVEPVLAPARRLLPPMGGLDLSPIIVIVIIAMLEMILPDLYGRFVGLFG